MTFEISYNSGHLASLKKTWKLSTSLIMWVCQWWDGIILNIFVVSFKNMEFWIVNSVIKIHFLTPWYCYCCWSTGKIRIDGLITTTLMCSSRICEFRLGQLYHCDSKSIISFGNSNIERYYKLGSFNNFHWNGIQLREQRLKSGVPKVSDPFHWFSMIYFECTFWYWKLENFGFYRIEVLTYDV